MSLWNAYSSTLYGEGKISKVLEKNYKMKYYKASSAMKKDNIHGFKLFLLRNKGIKLKEVNENDIDGLVQEYWNHIDEVAQKTTGYEGFKNGVTYQAKFAGINTTTTGIANANYGWGGGLATSKSQVDFFTCQFHMEGDVFVYGEQGNIQDIEITGEEIKEDGEHAKVSYKYMDSKKGKEKKDKLNLVKIDGKWMIDSGK